MFKKRKDKSSYFAECAFMKSEYRYYLNSLSIAYNLYKLSVIGLSVEINHLVFPLRCCSIPRFRESCNAPGEIEKA